MPDWRSSVPTVAVFSPRLCRMQSRRDLLSGSIRELVQGLNRTTVRGLIIDEDRRSCVELVPDLLDLRDEWDVVETIVGALARYERFDDAA